MPEDKIDAKRIRQLTLNYKIFNGTLNNKGFSTPYLRYVAQLEITTILSEVHEGYAADHEGEM